MTKINVKKTLNLHKCSIRVSDIFSNWKFILPIVFSILGLVTGTCIAKGEGMFYKLVTSYLSDILLVSSDSDIISDLILYLLIPTIFFVIIFFCGLSVYGGMVAHCIPFGYSLIIGIITYYFYFNYTLKGLAYCVIIIFPYAVLSLFSLILVTGECINMSQVLARKLNKISRNNEYNFIFYYKNSFKSYIFIVLAVIIKLILDSLFISLFSF